MFEIVPINSSLSSTTCLISDKVYLYLHTEHIHIHFIIQVSLIICDAIYSLDYLLTLLFFHLLLFASFIEVNENKNLRNYYFSFPMISIIMQLLRYIHSSIASKHRTRLTL